MLHLIQNYLREVYHFKFPLVFSYYSTRMILAAITSLMITVFLGPWFIRKLTGISRGQSIRTEDCPSLAEKHKVKRDTPTMGGLLILAAMLVSMFLYMDIRNVFTLILFLTTVILGYLGATDDYAKLKKKSTKGITGKKKLAIQVAVSVLVVIYLLVPIAAEGLHFGNWFAPPVLKDWVNGDGLLSIKDFAKNTQPL